jgi:protein-S-isoprenylcysteine O-methyltransferase Ste14
MFILFRTLVYATLFIAFVLVFLPGRVLRAAGVATPSSLGPIEIIGVAITLVGGALALACVLTFALVGRGTPAPFDPPRRLVARGPYRCVRNPMYIGATVALGGATLFYRSWALATFTAGFWLVAAGFVLLYEEPTLRKHFGAEYESYCNRVARWWPRCGSREPGT